jgi:hypothetical protein
MFGCPIKIYDRIILKNLETGYFIQYSEEILEKDSPKKLNNQKKLLKNNFCSKFINDLSSD